MLLIGLDAASQFSNFGYALGQLDEGVMSLDEFGVLESREDTDALANKIVPALRNARRALLAIDAPLGWPEPFGRSLANHNAGEPLDPEKSSLFRRATDQFVAEKIRKMPLEVAADKIARAAHSALQVLRRLRVMSGLPIPLAWSPDIQKTAAIEVYPAATLKARGLTDTRYKKPTEGQGRKDIARALYREFPELQNAIDAPPDAFDACLCMIAAKDFLDGCALPPQDLGLARREGWIWVCSPRR